MVDIEATFFPEFDDELKEKNIDVGAKDYEVSFLSF